MAILLLMLLLLVSQAYGQPIEYLPRGSKTYLVNYDAIGNDIFLTKLAYKRFAFLDEASKASIDYIRRFDKDYPILFYKDIVALHNYYPEFKKLNLDEEIFLHSAEPSCLTITWDKTWKFFWMADRRFDTTVKVAYRLYWSLSFDSIGSFNPVDTIVRTTELQISLPKSARWVLLKSIIDDTLEIPYSFPVKLMAQDSVPLFVPYKLYSKTSSFGISTSVDFRLRNVTPYIPDSIYLYADFNANNILEENEKRVLKEIKDTLMLYVVTMNQVKAGIEFYLIVFYNGKQYRLPKEGYWTTNPNNRIKNEEYNYFAMDVTNERWRKSYIEEVLNAFTKGYNGLFADETNYKIFNWAVDANPPLFYSDSAWYEGILTFLREIKDAIGAKPLYFNGLFGPPSYKLLEFSDGGMEEGFVYTNWSGYASLLNWLASCNQGLACQNQYHKVWLPLSGVFNNSPQTRLYCLSSYLLSAGEKSYFAIAPKYHIFSHYPEFDIPLGAPLVSAKNSVVELRRTDANGKYFYTREFENCSVYVNPSPTDTVVLPELNGLPQIYVDTLLTIDGGRLYTIASDSILPPRTAKIILKGGGTKLTSPALRNPVAKVSGKGRDEIVMHLSVEAADSSTSNLRSNSTLPLYVVADLSKVGFWEDFVLRNDGTPANENFSTYSAEITIPPGAQFKNVKIPIVAFSTTGLISIIYATPEIENLDTSNLVPNFSFEYDVNTDGIPDGWFPYRTGFIYDTSGLNAQHLKRSVKIVNNTLQDTGGVYTNIVLNQQTFKPILIAGWSKCENVSGEPDNNYSVYVDFYSIEGMPWYGRTTKFSTGTHDWEYSATIHNPPILVSIGRVYCLFRGHTGTVWFDNIFVGEVDTNATFVGRENNIRIRVPSVVTGFDDEVILISSNSNTSARIVIFDLLGNVLTTNDISLTSEMNIIPFYALTYSLTSGTYVLRIEMDNFVYNFPFMVIR